MGHVVTRLRSFVAGAAIAKHLRVVQSAGKLAVAGITDNDIGTIDHAVFADNDDAAVNLRSGQGTELMVANGVIAADALVYTAAGGKISATAAATSFLRGRALEAAAADNDIIEVLPMFSAAAETG